MSSIKVRDFKLVDIKSQTVLFACVSKKKKLLFSIVFGILCFCYKRGVDLFSSAMKRFQVDNDDTDVDDNCVVLIINRAIRR